MKAYGSLTNRYMETCKSDEPVVGMGATECCWSDRHAYTIIKVKSKCRLLVQQDIAIRTDDNGMSECQDYKFKPNPKGRIVELIKTKHGWKELGGCTHYLIGTRDEYYDYSF